MPARFEMVGVSADPAKPHVLHIRHLGISNPIVMNALMRGENPSTSDVIERVATRGAITWDGVRNEDGTEADPTIENVTAYLRDCVDAGFGARVLDLGRFASDEKNYGAASEAPGRLGE